MIILSGPPSRSGETIFVQYMEDVTSLSRGVFPRLCDVGFCVRVFLFIFSGTGPESQRRGDKGAERLKRTGG